MRSHILADSVSAIRYDWHPDSSLAHPEAEYPVSPEGASPKGAWYAVRRKDLLHLGPDPAATGQMLLPLLQSYCRSRKNHDCPEDPAMFPFLPKALPSASHLPLQVDHRSP